MKQLSTEDKIISTVGHLMALKNELNHTVYLATNCYDKMLNNSNKTTNGFIYVFDNN